MTKFIVIVLSHVALYSCGNSLQFFSKEMKAADIRVLVLNNTEATVYEPESEYIANREVVKEVQLPLRKKKKLIRALLSEKNHEPLTRKCKLEPVYAIKIDDKLFALFDTKFCPFVEFFDELGEKKVYQLIKENSANKIFK